MPLGTNWHFFTIIFYAQPLEKLKKKKKNKVGDSVQQQSRFY
jgi:hypothetical protein